jgi:hypothetical protein
VDKIDSLKAGAVFFSLQGDSFLLTPNLLPSPRIVSEPTPVLGSKEKNLLAERKRQHQAGKRNKRQNQSIKRKE